MKSTSAHMRTNSKEGHRRNMNEKKNLKKRREEKWTHAKV
jgi:hypothetical protein